MALKRPKGDPGTLVVLEHTSKILKGNPLGDNVPERAARLIHEKKMGPAIIVFPDCFTALGGNRSLGIRGSSPYNCLLLPPARSAARPGRGYCFQGVKLAAEPPVKRTIAFVDGQNLFHAVKSAFGYTYPNYDVKALAQSICAAKLLAMSRQGVWTFSRPLRYRNQTVKLPDGTSHAFLAAEEKGVDVRIALDVIRLAHRRDYDVALVFSQDQDLSEVAAEIRVISTEQARWIKMASAFPVSPAARNKRGINSTDWVQIDRAAYDACIDPRNYRPKP